MSAVVAAFSAAPTRSEPAIAGWLLPASVAVGLCLACAVGAHGAIQPVAPAISAWATVMLAPLALAATAVALHDRLMDGRRADYASHLADAVGASLWAALVAGVAVGAFGVAVSALGGLAG